MLKLDLTNKKRQAAFIEDPLQSPRYPLSPRLRRCVALQKSSKAKISGI
jgi:hypothetical protein